VIRRDAARAAVAAPRALLWALAAVGLVATAVAAQAPSPVRHGRVTGRVLSPSGEPLAGAEIAIVPLSSEFDSPELDTPCWLASAESREVVARTTSAADGRFEIPASPPSGDPRLEGVYADLLWNLVVRAPRCRPLIREDAPGAGAALDCGDVRMLPGAAVRGRVVDSQGAPLAAAEVSLSTGPLGADLSYRQSSAYAEISRTRTDADGRFEFASSFAGSPTLNVRHREAAASLSQAVAAKQGELTDLGALAMARGGTISGRVLDEQGQPVAGARLFVADGTLTFEMSEAQDPVSVARTRLAWQSGSETGADGAFVARGIPGPSAHLLVLAPGRDAALLRCVPAGADELEIVLRAEGRLLVQVSATSVDTVEGVEIVALRASGSVFGGRPLPLPVTRLGEDDETLYSIGQVGPALTRVQVTAPGFAPAWVETDGVQPGKHKLLTVDLRPAAVLEGLVVDLEDKPLSGVEVSAMNLEAMFNPDFLTRFSSSMAAPVRAKDRASARTDAQGQFSFRELTPGPWTLEASLVGYARTKDSMMSLSYGSTRTLRLRMRPASAESQASEAGAGGGRVVLRGRVLAGGAPVPRAIVWVEAADSRPLRRAPGVLPGALFEEGFDAPERRRDDLNKATADETGAYELHVLPATQWRLCAASPEGGLSEPQDVDAGGDGGAAMVRDLELGTHDLTVAVLAEQDGQPLPRCWVWVEPAVPSDIVPGVWRTDERGRTVIRHLWPGPYTVAASLEHSGRDQDEPDDDTDRRSMPVDVADTDDGTELVIEVPRGGRIEGVVKTPTGVLVPDGTRVRGTCKVDGPAPRVQAATKDGRFVLVGLRAGTWRVYATESGSELRPKESPLGESIVELDPGATAKCQLEVVYRGPKAYKRELTREEYYTPTAFDPAQWKDGELVGDGVRIRMIDDLLARHELVGMTRDEVIALLGLPSERFTEEPVLTWYLGNERSAFSIDSEWLSLTVGDGDRVTEKRVWAD